MAKTGGSVSHKTPNTNKGSKRKQDGYNQPSKFNPGQTRKVWVKGHYRVR